jgi:hypothetical protein
MIQKQKEKIYNNKDATRSILKDQLEVYSVRERS